MDKKGVLGLDTAKAVFIWFLILAILAITIVLALASLRDVTEDIDKTSVSIINETVIPVLNASNSPNNLAFLASDQYRNAICSNWLFTNATTLPIEDNTTNIPNKTNAGCSFAVGEESIWVNSTLGWTVSYDVTYSSPESNLILQNISGGLTNSFFNQTGTIFAIIIVIVIILAIAIIIAVVTRFGAGSGIGSQGGGSSTSQFGSDTVMGV